MASEGNYPKVEIVKPVFVQEDTFSSGTNGSVVNCRNIPCSTFALSVKSNDGTATSWAVEAQGSDDALALTDPANAAWTTLKVHEKSGAGEGGIVFAAEQPVFYFRSKVTEFTPGATAVSISSVLKGMQ